MPVEALTKEEAERLTREMVGRLLRESGFSRRLSDLGSHSTGLEATTDRPR
jgi:hypothetical protein